MDKAPHLYYQNLIAYRTSTCDFYIYDIYICMYTYLYIYIYIQRIASVVFLSSSIISVCVAPCSDDDKQQKRLCLVLQGKIQTSLPVICARMLYDCHLPHTPRPLPPLMVVVYGVARTTVTCSVVEAVFLYIMHEPCRCTFT